MIKSKQIKKLSERPKEEKSNIWKMSSDSLEFYILMLNETKKDDE